MARRIQSENSRRSFDSRIADPFIPSTRGRTSNRITRLFRVVIRFKAVIEDQGPLRMIQIRHACMHDPEARKRARQKALEWLDPIHALIDCAQPPALRGSSIAKTGFLYIPGQFSFAVERQFPCPLDAVCGRRLLWHLNEFAAFGRHQQAIICLKVPSNPSEGRHLVGGIKEQNPSQPGVLRNRDECGIFQVIGQLDGKNDMIETVVRRRTGRHRVPLIVDHHMVRVHANLTQHGSHQSGFIFAVPVAVGEHIRRGMGLPTTNTERYRDITNVVLQERGDGLHPCRQRRSSPQPSAFTSCLIASDAPNCGIDQASYQTPHALPASEFVLPRLLARRERTK